MIVLSALTYLKAACLGSDLIRLPPFIRIVKKKYSAYLKKHYDRPDCVDRSWRNVYYVDSSEVIDSATGSRKVYTMTNLELRVMINNLHAFSLIAENPLDIKGYIMF